MAGKQGFHFGFVDLEGLFKLGVLGELGQILAIRPLEIQPFNRIGIVAEGGGEVGLGVVPR
jgi:hypothetical protein